MPHLPPASIGPVTREWPQSDNLGLFPDTAGSQLPNNRRPSVLQLYLEDTSVSPEDLDNSSDSIQLTERSSKIALVFSDVENSTHLWEVQPKDMGRAMRLHNQCLRKLIAVHAGYEVKTEGDSFFVVFADVLCALKWCFDVQLQLLKLKWPESIIALPEACEKMHTGDCQNEIVIFRGLRVRMGIHCGQPICMPDPVTFRKDYHGPVVNLAARVASAACGGQIVVSEDVYHEESAKSLSDASWKAIGTRQFKGIKTPRAVFQVLPKRLKGRFFPLPNPDGECAVSVQVLKAALAQKSEAMAEAEQQHRAQVAQLQEEIERKEGTIEDLRSMLQETQVKHDTEIEICRLQIRQMEDSIQRPEKLVISLTSDDGGPSPLSLTPPDTLPICSSDTNNRRGSAFRPKDFVSSSSSSNLFPPSLGLVTEWSISRRLASISLARPRTASARRPRPTKSELRLPPSPSSMSVTRCPSSRGRFRSYTYGECAALDELSVQGKQIQIQATARTGRTHSCLPLPSTRTPRERRA